MLPREEREGESEERPAKGALLRSSNRQKKREKGEVFLILERGRGIDSCELKAAGSTMGKKKGKEKETSYSENKKRKENRRRRGGPDHSLLIADNHKGKKKGGGGEALTFNSRGKKGGEVTGKGGKLSLRSS